MDGAGGHEIFSPCPGVSVVKIRPDLFSLGPLAKLSAKTARRSLALRARIRKTPRASRGATTSPDPYTGALVAGHWGQVKGNRETLFFISDEALTVGVVCHIFDST
jgi:hypothetical protein